MRLKNAFKSYFVFMIACLFVVTSVSGENIKTFIIINGVGYDNDYSEQGNEEYDWLLKESRAHHGNFDDVMYFTNGKWKNFKSGEVLEEGFDGRYLLFNKDGKMEEVNESGNNIKKLKVVSVGAQKDRIILTFNMMIRGMSVQRGRFYSVNGKILKNEDITLDYLRNRVYLNVEGLKDINTVEINKEAFKDYSTEFENLKYEIVRIENSNQIKDDGRIYVLMDDDIELKGDGVSGNLYVGGDNIRIKGLRLKGNLVVDPGEDGNFTLSNSEVSSIVILSGGTNSIHIDGSKVENISVQSSMMRLAIENGSEINMISVQTVAQIESSKSTVKEVEIQAKGYKKIEELLLKGEFNKVVSKSGVNTILDGVNIKKLQLKVDPNVRVRAGKIEEVEVYSNGSIHVEDNAEVREVYTNGNKIDIDGKIELLKDKKDSNPYYVKDKSEEFKGKWIRHNVFLEYLATDISFEGVKINGKIPDQYIIKSKDGLDLTKKLSITEGFRILRILVKESFVQFYNGDELLGKCSMKIQNDDLKGTFKSLKGEWNINDSYEDALTSELNINIQEEPWNKKIKIFSGDLLIGELSQKNEIIRSLKIILDKVDDISIEVLDNDDNLVERVYLKIESELELIK